MNRALASFMTTAVAVATLGAPALAQQQQQNQNSAQASGWFKTCNENDTRKVCNVQYRIAAANGVNITSINLIEVTGDVERKVMQLIVPTGRSLPPGIQVRVDDKRATSIPFLYCRPQGCVAEVRLDDTLVGIFKQGGKVEVTTINFQGKENPVPVSLQGFTAAYDGPPVEVEDPNARQETLAEQLRLKAEEERAKSESGSQ